MPSSSKCRKSARLSSIARTVYGPERVRLYPAPLLSTYPTAASMAALPSQCKEGKRRGY
ncbi:MAG: hypothetical protein H0X24_13840 [Ktedonobacterales bacterium]|nr:hypothetical protein [Ktedonobacterales bacterium]